MRLRDGQLELESHDALVDKLQSDFRSIPAEISLVDELIAERREEARRDELETLEWLARRATADRSSGAT